MLRLRCRKKPIFFSAFIVGIILVLFLIILSYDGIFRQVFYSYNIAFHGIPGAYLATKTPNESYCNFQYGLPEELLYEDGDLLFPIEEKYNSTYRILKNVIEAKSSNSVPEVTYATHATTDFLNYVAELIRYIIIKLKKNKNNLWKCCRFWEGPISVAAFVPDYDADLAIRQLAQLCFCSPEMSRVSVHFVFPLKSPPYLQNHPEPLTCNLPDSSKLSTFRLNKELMFPINICRNIARNYSQTEFVMVSDIQLIPSKELASKFVKMVRSTNAIKPHSPSRVFVVPVFEIEIYDIIPKTKDELLMMVKKEKAVYFHKYICSHCQKFPGIQTWLESVPANLNIKVI